MLRKKNCDERFSRFLLFRGEFLEVETDLFVSINENGQMMENLRTVAARVAAGIQTWARINTGNGLAVTRAEQSVNVLLFFLLSSAALNDLMRTVSIVDSIAVLSLHLRLNETLFNYKKIPVS